MSCSSNLTSGFIDLATFDEIEKYMYGGPDATAYFVRETRKSTWFTQCPVNLSCANGQKDFGREICFQVSRAGDYLLQTWLRVTVPAFTVSASGTDRVAWTPMLAHHLVECAEITFNDLVAEQFTDLFLDFWANFTVPASKWNGYANMVGNVAPLTT